MRRELSSRYTFVYRWIIPGCLTLAAIAVIWRFARIGMPDRPATLEVLAGAAIAITLMTVARFFDKAKRVWIDGNTLILSAYGKEAEVDLSEIDSVTAPRLVKPDRIQLQLARPTIFGDTIVFFPPFRMRRHRIEAHPVLTELDELISKTRDSIE
ncbi:MAG: hypothetical protein HKN81_06255 [Gammaproteobacteria bacterium]|nr:hypothetical protein [Gammaproteobacteria bacterium]NND36724.1 hypothetical protein [Gammaproteobacteria bacterium]